MSSHKSWRMKTGDYIDIAEMTDNHLNNTISMLRRGGFVTEVELEMLLWSEPNGEMAQEAYFSEMRHVVVHPVLKELEAERERRKLSSK